MLMNTEGHTEFLNLFCFVYKYGAHGVKRALEIMHMAHLVEENQNRMKRNNNKNGKIDWIFFCLNVFFSFAIVSAIYRFLAGML